MYDFRQTVHTIKTNIPSIVLLSTIAIVIFWAIVITKNVILPPQNISLDGPWRITYEDSMAFSDPDYDDETWPTIELPGKITDNALKQTSGTTAPEKGICWIRKTIDVPDSFQSGGISLGRIANADEAYFNGRKIGSTGRFPDDAFSMWNHPRTYTLMPDVPIYPTGNVIAVRIYYDILGEVNGHLSFVGFQSHSDKKVWDNFVFASRFLHVTMGYVAIAGGLTLLTIFCLIYYRKPVNDENLYYCLQLFFGMPIVLEVCTYWNFYPDNAIRLKILGISWVALNVAHPIFLHRIYELKRYRFEKVLWAYLGVITIITLFFTSETNFRINGLGLILLTWFIGMYNLSCHITALIKKHPYAKTFSFFGIAVVLCAMNDGLVYFDKFLPMDTFISKIAPDVMIFHIGALFLYTGTSLVMVARYINFSDEIEDLNASLESFIIENALLNEQLSKKKQSGISTRSRKKINKVIDYIDENYLSDLSRTQLAETVGVHPDNLGKQFKHVTGLKLGDYIYKLRINEAANRLVSGDEKIIDIAFSTGFDSLRTFNRVFPKFMGTTPDKYRKKFKED